MQDRLFLCVEQDMKHLIRLPKPVWTLLFWFVYPASGGAQPVLESVSPASAEAGTTNLTVTFTLPDSTPPTPPAQVVPSSVTMGDISGSSITRVDFETVTAVFDIPADASGSVDCTVTFPTPSGSTSLSLTDGFTIGSTDISSTAGPPASGYNLFSPLGSTDTYLMDKDQTVLNTWTSTYGPGLSLYLLPNGDLIRTASTDSTDFDTGGAAGRVEQYDWEGNPVWEYDYDTADHRSHHDIEILPSGNILIIAWQKKTEAEAIAAGRDPAQLSEGELWPDSILEIEPTGTSGGNIVWEWHVWDHLIQDHDASKANYGVVADHPEKIDLNYMSSAKADWNHINAIDYNAERKEIILSVRNFSEIWVIDHDTTTAEAAGSDGDLLYRWGNPAAHGGNGDQKLYVQHDAKWIESGLEGEGNILIFNNGQGRDDGDYSSVLEISLPERADGYDPSQDATEVWSYTAETPTEFYASRISGAQRLRNGNTLICEGTESYVFEVTKTGEKVWEYTGSGELFRFERYAPDFDGFANTELALSTLPYVVVDTAQENTYDNSSVMDAPESGEDFYGQDAQHHGNKPLYEVSPDDKTVYDYQTRLTWTRSPDWNEDGSIDVNDKMTYAEAVAYVSTVNAANFGGYSDWRLPSIKEVYSLMDFRGTDPMSDDTSTLVTFLDAEYFEVAWGDTANDERTIDSQVASTALHLDTIMSGPEAMSGLNIADGRIKAYPTSKNFLVYLCRGNTDYGDNDYTDNGDDTITDAATGLMWMKNDSGSAMLWKDALAYVEARNAETYLGYDDWRLPNAKELHSILDYDRAPTATDSAAIDAVFSCTEITNEGGVKDWPWYFTSTTHARQDGSGSAAVYLCFGRAMGYFGNKWDDVHGSGAQRSDSKTVDTNGYTYVTDGWYYTSSPQGDATRWTNYVRLVRDVPAEELEEPTLTLTTETQSVAFDIKTFSILGTLTGAIAGIDWSNALTGESGSITPSGSSFEITDLPLDQGDNVITLTANVTGGDPIVETLTLSRALTFDGSVIYVHDETTATSDEQNGRSWTTAFADLQDALAVVAEGQEIHVAGGSYYPDEAAAGYATVTDDDRGSTFSLPEAVTLYGGYNASTGERDPDSYTSVLNGDLDQDDEAGEGGIVEEDPSNHTKNNNAYSVVTVTGISSNSPTRLDGFTITAGRANENTSDATGLGGGLYVDEADGFLLQDCRIIGNYAWVKGGGIYWRNSGTQTIGDCDFIANESNSSGAAVYLDTSTLTFTDCHFSDNMASGSTVWVEEANATFHRTIFQGNRAEGGGGIHVSANGRATATNCLFAGNNTIEGGAATVVGTFVAENCTMAANSADHPGGAVIAYTGSVVTLTNCLISGNQDQNGVDSATAAVRNVSATVTISYSCIRGSGGSSSWDASLGTDGGGNIDSDPLFTDAKAPGDSPTLDGEYTLAVTSPAINAGLNDVSMDGETDLAGNDRVQHQRVDMGCYEQRDLQILDADSDEDGLGDWDELITYETDPNDPDSDADVSNDGDEMTAGTDPGDETSVFTFDMTLQSDGDLTFTWTMTDNRMYTLYRTEDLTGDQWEVVRMIYPGSGTANITLEPESDIDCAIYKLEVSQIGLE